MSLDTQEAYLLVGSSAAAQPPLIFTGANDSNGRVVRVDRAASFGLDLALERKVSFWSERQVMAGVVRSRTAASWQRNSQKGPVPQRRLRGSPDARFGSLG